MTLVKRISWAASIAVLLGVGIVGGVATWLSIRSLDRHAQEALEIIGANSAARIGDWVAANERLVDSMAPETVDSPEALADPGGKDDARLLRTMEVVRNAGGFRQIFAGIAGDRRYLRLPAAKMPAGYDPTSRPWFRQAAAAGKLVIPTPYFDAVDHDLVMTFALPIKRNNGTFAVIGGLNSLDTVRQIVDGTRPTEHSYATVIDHDGRILIHPDPANALKPATEVLPWFKPDAASNDVAPIDDHGRAAWVRLVDIPHTPWRMAVVLDRADVQADLPRLVGSIAVTGALVAVIAALLLTGFLDRSFAALREVGRAMADIAQGQGDLNAHIRVGGDDEVGRIGAAFNAFSDKLRRLVMDVQGASAQVEVAAREIASGNQDLASRTEREAGMIQACAHSMLQIDDASSNSLANATEAARIARHTADQAAAGGEKMTNLVVTMEEIRESSRKINEIIAVIDGIAFQTNILALNAAVEAARAGVQGRGFAVVAAEVRTLAQRSADAAHDIRALIVGSSARVEAGAQRLDDASQSISSVVDAIQSLSQLVGGILEATESQRSGVASVKESFVKIDLMTQQNAALVEEAAAAAESLRDQSQVLSQTIVRFRT